MDPQLIDLIYESSFVPELWPRVLAELAKIATARVGFLFLSNGDDHQFASSTELGTKAVAPLVASGVIARSERFHRLVAARHSGFLIDSDVYLDEEKDADPFYRDLLYPRGLGFAAATTAPLPTGDRVVVALEREYARGPVEPGAIKRLNVLRPHIARSALMAERPKLERAQDASEALAPVRFAKPVLHG